MLLLRPMALVLRSSWALGPALFGITVLLVRTALEDRFPQSQLTGYAGYACRVRYRLAPGIW